MDISNTRIERSNASFAYQPSPKASPSTMALAWPASDVPWEDALQEAVAGAFFWKWTQGSKLRRLPERRYFRVDPAGHGLSWGRKAGRAPTGALLFADVIAIAPAPSAPVLLLVGGLRFSAAE